MSVDWHCLVSQKSLSSKKYLSVSEVIEHPLKPLTVTALDNRNTRKINGTSKTSSASSSTISLEPLSMALDGCDPLTLFAKQEASMDPLTKDADELDSSPLVKTSGRKPSEPTSMLDASTALWASRRSTILSKFTTSEKLSIVTSFLTGGEMLKTNQNTIAEKVRHRLEQLDDCDEVHHMLDLTQQEYVLKIELLNHELVQAWNTDQRVKALKIAIQCAKLLADTSVLQFYPSQFVLVTDILDNFGRLVFERLRTKAEYFKPGCKVATSLPENFTPEMVPPAAKETCENWFYKIASIRELLPRLYVEIAILRSYSFLTQNEFSQALLRLTQIIRGIGDPLISTYVRCYLCRVGMTVTSDRSYIKSNLNDYLSIYHTMFAGSIQSEVSRQRFEMTGYLSLYQPALDWIMQALAAQGSDVLLDDIINQCQGKKNNGLLLNSIIASYRPPGIAARALLFVNIIANSPAEGFTKAQLFRTLGICLNQCAPPSDQKLPVFNGVWKIINTLTHNGEYISCIEPWAAYTSLHFGLREINTMMGEVLARMNQNRAFESFYPELQSIADKIITHSKDFEGLLALDNFLPFIDLFQKDSVRLEVCKQVMLACRSQSDGSVINDPVISNALMYICKLLSDTVNELTVEDERRLISQLINSFIRRADYGRDVEKQLTFYVDARAAFANLDSVFVALVHCVNRLAMETRRLVNGQHNRKTAAFVKACAAYCYITIPSIASVSTRMDLYILSGQVALQNQCLGQADACFEAALQLVPELPKTIDCDGKSKSTEPYLTSFLANFLSTLIVVPDSPDQGVLFLVRKLLDLVDTVTWDANGTGAAHVYLNALDMLTVAAQDVYPYHIPGVISNDELYGSDPKFLGEIDSLCSHVGEQLLVQLKTLGDAQQLRAQASLAVEVFLKIVFSADMCREKLLVLAGNLWALAMKNRSSLDPKYPGKILLKVDRLKGQTVNAQRRHALEELTTKMKSRM